MRSGTSFFNGTVFKKTVFRFWPLWAAYFVIWLVTLPLNGLMILSMQAASSEHTTGYMENFACRTVPGMANGFSGTLLMAVVFGLLAAMAVLSHLYNARSANFFGSLPVKREGLFVTHYLAGLCFLIVPNLAIALLTLLIEALGGWVSLAGMGFWLAASCVECFLFYSMAVFCGVFTGHILALPVFYAVLNAIAAGAYGLVNWVRSAFFYGYTNSSNELGYKLVRVFTPVWGLNSSLNGWYTTPADGPYAARISTPQGTEMAVVRELELRGLNWLAAYAVGALVLSVAAFLIYRARRLESAGDVVSVRPMRPVFKYGVALCSGFAFGLLTCQFLGLGEIGLMVAVVIWGVAGYFAAQMLLDKSFRVFKKWKGAVAVTAVFVVLFLAVAFDFTGFETRIPDIDNVESVHFSGLDASYLGDSGDYGYAAVSDPAQIELLMTLHRAAISQRGGWRPSRSMDTNLSTSTSLNLAYYLKDGSTLERRYQVYMDPAEYNQEGTAAWALEQLYADREMYWDIYGFQNMERAVAEDGWRMEQAQYEYYRYEETMRTEQPLYLYGKDAQALFDAMKEDFFAGRIGVRSLSDVEFLRNNHREYERTIRFIIVDSNGNQNSTRIFVQDTATSTLAALEAMKEG